MGWATLSACSMSSNAGIVTATFEYSRGTSALTYRWTWNPRPHHWADISPYNYLSIMHYEFLSSKRNRRGGPPALETIPPHMPVGQYAAPSDLPKLITPGDADVVARMFGLTPTSWTVSTNPLGLNVDRRRRGGDHARRLRLAAGQ